MNPCVDVKYDYLLTEHKWYNIGGYLATDWKCSCGPRTTMTLHKLILNIETLPEDICPCDSSYVHAGLDIAHLNHIKTDCRLQNLEYQLKGYNNSDQPKLAKHSSMYTGVNWNKRDKKWYSNIRANSKLNHIGLFDTELEAARARDQYVVDNNLIGQYKLNLSH